MRRVWAVCRRVCKVVAEYTTLTGLFRWGLSKSMLGRRALCDTLCQASCMLHLASSEAKIRNLLRLLAGCYQWHATRNDWRPKQPTLVYWSLVGLSRGSFVGFGPLGSRGRLPLVAYWLDAHINEPDGGQASEVSQGPSRSLVRLVGRVPVHPVAILSLCGCTGGQAK